MGSSIILPSPGQPTTGPDPGFKTAATPNIVTFGFDSLAPPSPLYIQRDDQLLIDAASSVVGSVINVSGRLLLPTTPVPAQPTKSGEGDRLIPWAKGGTIQPLAQNMPITVAYSRTQQSVPLAEGYLLSLYAPGIGQVAGTTFVRLSILRGTVANQQIVALLCSGYIVGATGIGWPGGRIVTPVEGPGNLRSVTVANPAAGADWSLTVPASARWRVQSWSAIFTASATVASRQVRSQISDGVQIIFSGQAQAAIVASQVAQVSAGQGQVTSTLIATEINPVLPGLLTLPGGFRVQTLTTNIQVGDQWSAIRVNVEEWIELQ